MAAEGTNGQRPRPAERQAPVRRLLRLSRRPRPIVLALSAAVAALVVAAVGALQPNPTSVEIEIGGELVYHDFPDIIADLKGGGRRPRYVKLGVIVELPAELRVRLEEKKTTIIDALHAYLRERNAADLVGEKGADEVRGALLAIINGALAPGEAKTVLFRQFILS